VEVLVTGGTGVIGTSAITTLVRRGRTVRLLSRHAERDARAWPRGVAAVTGDVTDPATLAGVADGCDAVVHLVGIIDEQPPATSFQRVNVDGTENIVREAARAGVRKFVYVSSLGSEAGRSPYHESKRAAERIVRGFAGEWAILRPGPVYGPGDEHVSVLMKLVRTLPVVPVIGDGNQPIQPLWHGDLAEAIAMTVERDDLSGATYDMAGDEVTSQRDLIDRLRRLTNRDGVEIPVLGVFAELGIKVASMAGVDIGFSESQLQMLLEATVLPSETNAIVSVFGISPTPLDEGLRRLADIQPEQLPDDGIGPLERKRYWVDIVGSGYDAERLLDRVRGDFAALAPSIMSANAEPGSATSIEEGATLTLDLPLRGHVQVRVADVDDQRFTLITLDGHPLAGAVRIQTEPLAHDALRFEIQVYDRAGSIPDLVLMRTLGGAAQDRAWVQLIENVVAMSGGRAEEIRHSAEMLAESEAAVVQRWAEELVLMRKQHDAGMAY
jgi:NADH dehydrogenase